MTTQTDTMSGAWPFHDKTDWYYVWGLTISVCFVMKLLNLRHSISLFCHKMVKSQTEYQSVLSWNGQAPDIVSVCFVIKWSSLRHSISLCCHWQNRLILCLGLDHFMAKQTDTMSGAWPFHDKTDWYYVWGLTISWQHRLILCLRLDHFMTKPTDTMSEASPFQHSISLFCHEIVKSQT
jgi:hypothetical protein